MSEDAQKGFFANGISPLQVISGVVIPGKALGRTISFPTANISFPADRLKVSYGVYATIFMLGDERFRSITNIGAKPTVEDGGRVGIETHVLDFDRDIYGKAVTLEILFFLREISRFPDLQALKTQIDRDKRQALSFFDANGL